MVALGASMRERAVTPDDRPTKPEHRVCALRLSKAWSEEAFAERAGVSVSTVSRWETERFNPDIVVLKRVSNAMDVRAEYLIGEQIPELEGFTTRQIAARESLRIFLERHYQPKRRRTHRYWRAVDLPDAPKTVEGWEAREEFLRLVVGKKMT